jgi:tRNA-splicing ligase RtcB
MSLAICLPFAVQGTLMPNVHTGYGLLVGGVLAVDNAVIPYAVGGYLESVF